MESTVAKASVVQQGPPIPILHLVHFEAKILSHQLRQLLRISTPDSSQHDHLPKTVY